MKKLFTLLACILLAGATLLRAEDVSVYVTDENGVKYNNIAASLTESDGVFTLTNFVNNSSTSVYFKFNQNIEVDSVSAVQLVGDKTYVETGYEEYVYILNSNGKYPRGKFVNADTTLVVRYPYIYNDGTADFTYIMRLDKEEYGYDYYAYFSVSGTAEDGVNSLPYYDYEFYFNAPKVDKPGKPDVPVSLGEVDVVINDENSKEAAKGYKSALAVTSDGIYTLANFIDSGASLSFKLGSALENNDDYTNVIPTGNVEAEGSYYYILNDNGDYPTGKLYALEGSGVTNVLYPYVYADTKGTYSYVMKLDKTEWGYEYYACFNVSGFDANDDYLDDYYLEFYFNGKDAGVSSVVVDDENAPVEFYNLNGQRVVNPENGLFIRKQGSKVSKVIIR